MVQKSKNKQRGTDGQFISKVCLEHFQSKCGSQPVNQSGACHPTVDLLQRYKFLFQNMCICECDIKMAMQKHIEKKRAGRKTN